MTNNIWGVVCENKVLLQSPLDTDLIVDLVQDGVKLLFDPKLQRLKVRQCTA